MRLWQAVVDQLSGVWRSTGHGPGGRRAARQVATLVSADTADLTPAYAAVNRPARRRPTRVAGVAMLVTGAAVGTYLAVAGSLTALTADPDQRVPAAGPVVTSTPTATTPGMIGRHVGPAGVGGAAPDRQAELARRPQPPQAGPVVPTPVTRPATPSGPPTEPPSQPPPGGEATPSPLPSTSASPSPSDSASPSPSASTSSGTPQRTTRIGAGG